MMQIERKGAELELKLMIPCVYITFSIGSIMVTGHSPI